ncbi:cyclin-I-like isoform X2 [Oscarella lobularis]|uniref:cyclin-I-like isoform X2 n=1 Tax=Oscarella lobularis TaxID=121494 RepID=UPI003313B5CE
MSAYDRAKHLGFLREATVTWLSGRFHSTPKSLMFAISLLDRFLGIVCVKDLKCLAAACYYIAAKTTQESKFSASDIVLMKLVVLKKLYFDANAITPLHFIQFCMASLKAGEFLKGTRRTHEEHLRALVRRLQFCAQDYRFLMYRASTLGLALFMTECKQLPEFNWLTVSLSLQTACHIPGRELSICFEEVQEFFSSRSDWLDTKPSLTEQFRRRGSCNSKEKARIRHRRCQMSMSCRGEAELLIKSDTEKCLSYEKRRP